MMTEPAQSPFFAGTALQWAWDSTSLALLKECPRKYHYVMVEGWRAKGESVHLRFGGLYHSALEQYDKLRAEGAEPRRGTRGGRVQYFSRYLGS
jgi:hypothetical protein